MTPRLSSLRISWLVSILLNILHRIPQTTAQCAPYQQYSLTGHPPFSTGRYNLSYARPIPSCRTFHSPDLEDELLRMRNVITDPDLYRVFENTWPSTLDTTIAWRGYAQETVNVTLPNGTVTQQNRDTDQELSFIITGDIEAMWLRDSANQLLSYTSLLHPNPSFSSLASLFRGAINLQARYILEAPFCNAFQAPPESGIRTKSSQNSDTITPSFDFHKVFSCNWELDSLASFLDLSATYAERTGDLAFFGRYNWSSAVSTVLETAESMRGDSYESSGVWKHTPYTYCAPYGGTPINQCNGSPHRGGIGMVRSFHRPSDDACLWQYLVPSNMMMSVALERAAPIMEFVEQHERNTKSDSKSPKKKPGVYGTPKLLSKHMRAMALEIRSGIETHALLPPSPNSPSPYTSHPSYTYETDGYHSTNNMDDANVPSLLSAPLLNYTSASDPTYRATRARVLSKENPYFAWGKAISGVGSPHTLPGRVWPMAVVVGVLSSVVPGEGGGAGGGRGGRGGREEERGEDADSDEEIWRLVRQLVASTDGLGVMHESVDAQDAGFWSRQWFSWANGLFGQMVLHLEKTRPGILKMGFQ